MASDAAGVKTSPLLLPPTLATCWLLCNTKHLGNVASQKTIFSHYHFNMLYAQVFHIVQRELDEKGKEIERVAGKKRTSRGSVSDEPRVKAAQSSMLKRCEK